MEEEGITGFEAEGINILLRPVLTFILKYFSLLGFFDGKHGLVLDLFNSY